MTFEIDRLYFPVCLDGLPEIFGSGRNHLNSSMPYTSELPNYPVVIQQADYHKFLARILYVLSVER